MSKEKLVSQILVDIEKKITRHLKRAGDAVSRAEYEEEKLQGVQEKIDELRQTLLDLNM